jgi:hypothetical protein
VTIIHQDSPDKHGVVQTLEAAPRANTLALDTKTQKIYLPAAGFETVPAITPDAKPKQRMVPFTANKRLWPDR